MTQHPVHTVSFGKAIVLLALAMLIPTILFQGVFMLMYVPSESMSPTLNSGDVLLGSRVFSELERGDIVVFEKDGSMLIKRIIGLPGEEVRIADDGTIFVDGKNPSGGICVIPEGGPGADISSSRRLLPASGG